MTGSYVSLFADDLKRSFADLATIVVVIGSFQFLVLRTLPANWQSIALGLAIVGVGIALFMRGLEIGLFPLGEDLARHFASAGSRAWLLVFAFVIGFATTVAEPALIAIADKAAAISDGRIDALILRLVTAISVGCAIVIGVLRLLWNHPLHWYIISGYVMVVALTPLSPITIVGVAYDMGGVTTSTVTVPLIAALGIGLATSLKNRNPLIDGFGLIAFASLTPMIFVQLYGIAVYDFGLDTLGWTGVSAVAPAALAVVDAQGVGPGMSLPSMVELVLGLLHSTLNLLPIFGTIVFFFYAVLRRPIELKQTRAAGFVLVALGLYAFVLGLEMGLFPIGESISAALATHGNLGLVYLYAFAIGFATTVAEPSLTAIARKAEEISGGAMNALLLRLFVAIGVGLGILLGAVRIVHGDSLAMYVMVGYSVVVVATFFAPRTIIPIAYDSGGVTTSTVTVPIVAALGLGLASATPGRSPLEDGFGLIALASLFPVITVLIYGIGQQQQIRRHERYIANLEHAALTRVRQVRGEQPHRRASRIHKQIVTISGRPGSGTSSVAKHTAELLRYRCFSTGELFRRIAHDRGVSVDDLNIDAGRDDYIDHEIDQIIQTLGEQSSQIVINSRLGYHWIHSSFKVYLMVPTEIGAQRISQQMVHSAHKGETALPLTQQIAAIERRVVLEHDRYYDLYALDTSNMRPFDLVIDTTELTVEEVSRRIVAAYLAWSNDQPLPEA